MVNHSKEVGDLSAKAVNSTVHTGNRVVAMDAALVYAANALEPREDSSAGSACSVCEGYNMEYHNDIEVFMRKSSYNHKSI